MQRHPGCLLALCLTGALLLLLLLPLCLGEEDEYDYSDYNVTMMPDYDSNSTFEIIFFSNVSSVYDDWSKLFSGGKEDSDETSTVRPNSEDASANWASRMAPPSVLLILTAQRLCRLL